MLRSSNVDVLKGGFFYSSSHVCLGQASVSLGAPRMPRNLLPHGSQNSKMVSRIDHIFIPSFRSLLGSRFWDLDLDPKASGALCVVVFVFCFVFDLPCYMTTGVNVDFISNCSFTCEDRALERDRPYLREKKVQPSEILLLAGLKKNWSSKEAPDSIC